MMGLFIQIPKNVSGLVKHDAQKENIGKGAKYLLFNATCPVKGDPGDSVARLYIKSENSASYIFNSMSSTKTLTQEVWKTLISHQTKLLDFETLKHLWDNFRCVRQAIGEQPLGDLGVDSEKSQHALFELSKITPDIYEIDRFLREQSVSTPISRVYLEERSKSKIPDLLDRADNLAEQFEESRKVYDRLPAMTANKECDRSEKDSELRSAQFRRYCSLPSNNPLPGPFRLDYVGYEFKPLNINGFEWHNHTTPKGNIEDAKEHDYRLHSIDLIMAHEGQPVLVEVKMKSDKWASSAVVQLLYYASTMTSNKQMIRLQESYKGKLNDVSNKWLSIIVEDRNGDDFSQDFENAVAFFRDKKPVRDVLQPHFSGVYIAKIKRNENEGWTIINDCTRLVEWAE